MNRTPRSFGYFLGLLTVGMLSVAPAAAQSARPQPDEPLTATGMETVDVEIADVEVYVTDDKGRTVDGLTAADFRLYVDNDPTEIVNFYRAGGEMAAANAGESVGAMAREVAPGSIVVAGESRAGSPAPRPMTLVIYVDHLQLTPGGRRSFLRQIRQFLENRLSPGDQLMVVSHAGDLELEQRFSGDFSAVGATLEKLWQAPAGALDYQLKWRGAMDQIEQILVMTPKIEGADDPCQRSDQMHDVAATYGEWVAFQVERSLVNLERLVQVLGGLEGRKAMLYLSNGLHQNPGADLHLQVAELCPERSPKSVSNELSTRLVDRSFELTRMANARDVVLHTLDATGLEGASSVGVAAGHQIEVNGRTFKLWASPQVDSRRRDSRQATLFTLAHETGGLAVLNANAIDKDLGKIEDSLRRFYSLGFRPPAGASAGADENRSHLLRVELEPPRKGHTLHYRRTYVPAAPADRTVGHLMSALLLGMEDNPLGVGVKIGSPQVGDSGLPTVALRIELPFGSLGWLEEGDHRTGEVELFIAVQDGEGSRVDMRSKKIPFRIQESLWAEARGKSHVLEIGLPVPSADARLAFAVADRVGARTSYLSQRAGTGGSSGIATGL